MGVAVSVIMPSLNVVEYIEKCLESVVNQTLSNIEIICIDAGSEDGTLNVLKDYSQRDSRIKLIHSEIKSYGYQVNEGIKLARGEYIAILETDDYIAKDMYEKLYLLAKENDLDVAKADFYYRFEKGQDLYLSESHIKNAAIVDYNKLYEYNDVPKLVLYNSNIWSGIYRKTFLLDKEIMFNNSNGAAYQDIGFLVRLFYANPRIMFISDELYYYRYAREGSSSRNKNVLKFIEQEWLFIENKCLVGKEREKDAYALARLIICFIYEYNKLLKEFDFNKEDDITECFNRLKIKSIEAINKHPMIEQLLDCKRVREILDENYVAQRKEQLFKQEQENCRMKESFSRKQVVIFGAGIYGKRVRKLLFDWNIEPLCFYDNNSKIWGYCLDGVMVRKPDEELGKFEGIIIIANKLYYNEIEYQVKEYGFDVSRIVYARDILEVMGDNNNGIILP